MNNEALIGEEFATKGVALSVLEELIENLHSKATFHDVKPFILERTKGAKGNRSLASVLSQDPKTSHYCLCLQNSLDKYIIFSVSQSQRC